MAETYDFFGGPLLGQKRQLAAADFPLRVDCGTYRPTGTGHSVGGQPMTYIALFWPDREATERDNEAPPVKIGDPFPIDPGNVGDCDGVKMHPSGAVAAFCVLDAGHSPAPHVASNGQVIVEIWP